MDKEFAEEFGLIESNMDRAFAEEFQLDESLALQLKMALDDAKIKMKSNKGKIVIAKKDQKKAMDVLTKALPSKLKKYVDKAVDDFLVFEEVEVDERKSSTGYELYHKTFSDAMQHAYAHAKSKGHIVDPKEIDDKVATGPKKPSSGKTNRYSLKAGRKKVEIQVANLDNKRYELNMYIESSFDHLAKVKRILSERSVTQDKFFPKVLMDGIRKVIPGVKLVRHSINHPRSKETIPGLGLQLSGDKGIRVMIQYDKEDSPAPKGLDKTIVDIDPETGKKEVTDTSLRDGYVVWVNEVGKVWSKGEVKWVQSKEFRDPKKVVQFLKTKVKRMVKAGYMYSSYNKEEVEIQEEVSAKEFDALKKGDTVTIEFKSSMSTGKSSFKVTAKNVVGKARVEKVTLQNIKKPNTVKFFLYKRGNKVSLAQGDMAASVVSFMKEDKDLEKIVKELEGASKMHLAQSKRIQKHLDDMKSGEVEEGIDIEKADMKDVIKDFQNSDAPQFKGKSDKKRKEMAIAAKLSKEEKEEDDPKSKKKDKINLKPKMEDKQMKKLKELYAGLQKKRALDGTLKKTVSDYHKDEKITEHKGKNPHKHPHDKEEEVKEGVTARGIEYGEQDWDLIARNNTVYPNLNVNFSKYIDEGLEGPYELSGEVYFYDRKVHMFYSVSGEDYVDEETAKDIVYRLHKDGLYKPDLGR